MKPVRQIDSLSIRLLLVPAVVFAGLLPSPLALAQTLESRVESLEVHDEVLRSRQEVLTNDVSDFKDEVAEATAAIRAEMASEDASVKAEVSAIAVPVGGVIAWWGDLSSIPENFELCDGNPPTTPGGVLTGNKPDLLSRFIRGARTTVGATGGRDLIADATTWPHTLTLDQMPSHNHHDGTFKHLLKVDGTSTLRYSDSTPNEPNLYSCMPMQDRGGGQPHSHGISGHDNRPVFCELFYIIRVK